jgi:hypothetical protein
VLGGVLQVLDDGLVVVIHGLVEVGDLLCVDSTSSSSLGRVEQSINVLQRESLGLGDKVPDEGSGADEDGTEDEVGLGRNGVQGDRHDSDDGEGAEPL